MGAPEGDRASGVADVEADAGVGVVDESLAQAVVVERSALIALAPVGSSKPNPGQAAPSVASEHSSLIYDLRRQTTCGLRARASRLLVPSLLL